MRGWQRRYPSRRFAGAGSCIWGAALSPSPQGEREALCQMRLPWLTSNHHADLSPISCSYFVRSACESATTRAMNQPVLTINGRDISLGAAAAAFAVAVLAFLL